MIRGHPDAMRADDFPYSVVRGAVLPYPPHAVPNRIACLDLFNGNPPTAGQNLRSLGDAQLAAVGLETRPLAAVLIDAHVGQLAGVVELRAGVAEEAAGRQADAQPGAVAAQFQHAAFVGHARLGDRTARGVLEVFPE